MAPRIGELLSMVLQLDASDRAQAQLDMQQQQMRIGALGSFVGDLGRVKDPESLQQLKQFYAGAGIPVGTLDEVARQYTPTLAQMGEAAAQAGLATMPQDQLQGLQRATAYRAIAGTSQSGVAADQQAAADYANPDFNSPEARRASHFGRIGYDPGAFAMSEATASLGPGELKNIARVRGGTAIGAPDLANLVQRRDEFQVQAQNALQSFNRGAFESDREYALRMAGFMQDDAYKQAQIAALRKKAATGDPESLKELRALLEDVDKAKSPLVKNVFSQMIENQLGGQVPGGTTSPLQSPTPKGKKPDYSPSFWQRNF